MGLATFHSCDRLRLETIVHKRAARDKWEQSGIRIRVSRTMRATRWPPEQHAHVQNRWLKSLPRSVRVFPAAATVSGNRIDANSQVGLQIMSNGRIIRVSGHLDRIAFDTCRPRVYPARI